MGRELTFLVEKATEGGYVARCLGHSIFTQAESLKELRQMVADAVECHFDEDERPQVVRLRLRRVSP